MFAFIPGFRVVGSIARGERADPPNGAAWCSGCGSKWEIGPVLSEDDHERDARAAA